MGQVQKFGARLPRPAAFPRRADSQAFLDFGRPRARAMRAIVFERMEYRHHFGGPGNAVFSPDYSPPRTLRNAEAGQTTVYGNRRNLPRFAGCASHEMFKEESLCAAIHSFLLKLRRFQAAFMSFAASAEPVFPLRHFAASAVNLAFFLSAERSEAALGSSAFEFEFSGLGATAPKIRQKMSNRRCGCRHGRAFR